VLGWPFLIIRRGRGRADFRRILRTPRSTLLSYECKRPVVLDTYPTGA
jgi:hypothetical protein